MQKAYPRMLRRMGLIALCFLLLLSALPAHAAPGDAVLFGSTPGQEEMVTVEEQTSSVAAVGDTLYVMTDKGLYQFKVGDEAPTLLWEAPTIQYDETVTEEVVEAPVDATVAEAPGAPDSQTETPSTQIPEDDPTAASTADVPSPWSILLLGGERLRLLDKSTGILGAWDGKDILWEGQGQLAWEDMIVQQQDWEQTLEIHYPVVMDGALYALVDKSPDNWGEYVLTRFDLTTGVRTVLQAENLTMLCPYRAGTLAAFSRNRDDWQLSVVEINAQTGEVTKTLFTGSKFTDYTGLAYSAEQDALTLYSQGAIYRLGEQGLGEPLSYMISDNGESQFSTVLPGDYYVLSSWSGTQVRNLDPQYKAKQVLRIEGNYMSDDVRKFAAANPDVAVMMVPRPDAKEVTPQDLLGAKEPAMDLMELSLQDGLFALRDKGYLGDLSDSKSLMDAVQAMYPQFQEVLLHDGVLTGYPASAWAQFWTVDQGGIEALGGIPETMADWIDMIERWETENLAEEYPQYRILDEWFDTQQLLYTVLGTYLSTYDTADEPLRLDTPELREVLERIERLPSFGVQEDETIGGTRIISYGDGSEDTQPITIFSSYGSPFSYRMYGMEKARPILCLPPAFVKGQEAKATASVTVYVLHPNSPNRDIAIRFLEFLAEHGDAETRYQLRPDLNDPVPDPYRAEDIKRQEADIEQITAQMATAKEAEKKDLEEALADAKRWLEEYQRYMWRISPEDLARYRELAPQITLMVNSPFTSSSAASQEMLSDLFKRYGSGQIKVAELLREMEKKLQMIYLEGL